MTCLLSCIVSVAELIANTPSPIFPNRPISAPPEFRISLATPLESALPRSEQHHFVNPIESLPFFRISPFCTGSVPVTPVSTILTEHVPCNPIRMNTSGNHQQAFPLPPNTTSSYKKTYTNPSLPQADHSIYNLPPRFPPSFSRSLNSRPVRSISPAFSTWQAEPHPQPWIGPWNGRVAPAQSEKCTAGKAASTRNRLQNKTRLEGIADDFQRNRPQ
jgi:hypothetical protein